MSESMVEGLWLVLFGMGTVYFFLALLVLVTMGMSSIIMRLEPAPVIATGPGRSAGPAAEDGRRRAAIAAAIHRYREDNNRA